MHLDDIRQPRRTVIVGAGVGLAATAIAACSSSGAGDGGAAPTTSAQDGQDSSAAPAALTATADVPVGSGVIIETDKTVVTQPTAGVFKGLSAVCTHAGCTVSQITDGKIICPCHGSEYDLDGAVVKGPATKPLEAKPVTVEGDSIVAG